MALEIYMLDHNLSINTSLSEQLGNIEHDPFYYQVKKQATELGLAFIPIIDSYGNTIINKLQLTPLENEIRELRQYPGINHEILNTIQQAIDVARSSSSYIFFEGD